MGANLQPEDFSGHVGSSYEIQVDEGTVLKAKLAECTPAGKANQHRQPFSLLFKGPGASVLPQMIYPLRAPDGRELEIFLVTLFSDDQETQYEAVFS